MAGRIRSKRYGFFYKQLLKGGYDAFCFFENKRPCQRQGLLLFKQNFCLP